MKIVPKAGVRKRGWISRKGLGSAPAAAIDSEVREPGRIVVCAEEIPEMITAITRSLPSVGAQHLVADRAEDAGVVVELLDLAEPRVRRPARRRPRCR